MEHLTLAEATLHLDIPGQTIPDADACWLAPNEVQNDTSLISQTSFGMGAYLGLVLRQGTGANGH